MTDFRARGTIMGPAGLTAVFGMGTGVAPPVWSPGIRPGGGQAAGARVAADRSRPARGRPGRCKFGARASAVGVARPGGLSAARNPFGGSRHGVKHRET